mgnify:CR=1 FL=1
MALEDSVDHGKGKLVLLLVALGIVVLGAGAFVALKKRAGGASTPASFDETQRKQWCDLRRQWAGKVDPLAGDILLKMVQDPEAGEALAVERNKLCQQYARQVRDLKVTDPQIQAVEVALIKEGKVRANIAVEIANLLVQVSSEQIETLRRAKEALESRIQRRIAEGKAAADREVSEALAALEGCHGIYRGPMTDAATADNPYTSWDELSFRRTDAIRRIGERIKELEPKQHFTNQVYHRLVSKYRRPLKRCHSLHIKKNENLALVGLRVRLKRNGEVQSLGVEWVGDPAQGPAGGEGLLDCVLGAAGKGRWTFPRPARGGEYVVVTIDISKY